MNYCTPNEHRLEFLSCKDGETTYLCLECTETITQYQDTCP